jgi:hypothetical protein
MNGTSALTQQNRMKTNLKYTKKYASEEQVPPMWNKAHTQLGRPPTNNTERHPRTNSEPTQDDVARELSEKS